MPAPGTTELTLLSDEWLQLGFGATSRLRVALHDRDGEPIAGGVVTFALVGRPQDSSLASVNATTDEDGVAENTLIAGNMAAAFSVRITAPGAYERFVRGAVSNSGFGTLEVRADYSGARSVAQRVVFAQAGIDCEHAERMPGDPMVTLGPQERTAQFVALPAEVSYAILAFAESEDATIVATGCRDGVVVERDDQISVAIVFEDEPLAPFGTFALEAVLDAGEPAASLAAALRDGAETVVQTDSLGNVMLERAEARFLLDSLDSTLRSEDYAAQPGTVALADAIAQERMTPSGEPPEQSLQALLSIKDEGALAAVPRIAELTAADLDQLRLFAQLTVERDGATLPLRWQAQRIEALPADAGRAPVAIDLSSSDPVQAQATRVAGRDAITLDGVRFELPFGALAVQVLHEVVSFDAAGHGEEIRTLVGCTALGEWLAAQSYTQGGACGETCVQAACERAVARLVSAAEGALSALEEARPTLAISGELELGDADGDLQAEHMSSEMVAGEWEPEADDQSGDSLFGAATADTLAAAAQR